MGKVFRVRSGQGLGLLAALAGVLLVPITTHEAAAAQPMTSIAVPSWSQIGEGSAETPVVSAEALRTSGTLAAVALGTAATVWLWWYLMLRRRR